MALPPEQAAGRGRLPGVDLRSLLFWTALPVIALQGLWLRRHARRAPEAAGARCGEVGAGPSMRLLALGDSITVGVGLERLDQALPAQLAGALSARLGRCVRWQTGGRNGATTRALLTQVEAHGELLDDCDLLLLSIGVNDTTGLRARRSVAADLGRALDRVHARRPGLPVVLAGLPPLDAFPLLPGPLRQLMGLRARQIDAVLGAVARLREGVHHVAMPLAPAAGQFASDGFHPNAEACREWAGALCARLPAALLPKADGARIAG